VQTIRSPREIEHLFDSGRRATHPLLVVLAVESPTAVGRDGRVVFIAGKKLGGAVTRNRCKRVMRASCRRVGGPWMGADVALVARKGIASAPADVVDAALRDTAARAVVLQR
jgi:ribonuclease P protein component